MVALHKYEHEDESRELVTVEEYLRLVEQTGNPYEYLHGRIYLMAGASSRHGVIAGNIFTILRQALRGGPCRAFLAQTAVQVAEDVVFMPDTTVSCEDEIGTGVVSHPKVVVEVFSDSTENYDRGHKFIHYMDCPSMQAIIFIDTKHRLVTIDQKLSGRWDHWPYYGGDTLEISCLGLEISVDDLYEDSGI